MIFLRRQTIHSLLVLKALAMGHRWMSLTFVVCSAITAGLLGCAAEPQTAYDNLLQIDSTWISYTFADAITAALPTQIVKNIELEISLEDSDPAFDPGWTISYYESLRFEGSPGKRYTCRVRSICHCFGFTKTLVLPYVYVVSTFGDSLGEGPEDLIPKEPTMTLPIHLDGRFEFTTGDNGACYLLILGDNRDPGKPSASWNDVYMGTDGADYQMQGDIVASPLGTVRVLVEDLR